MMIVYHKLPPNPDEIVTANRDTQASFHVQNSVNSMYGSDIFAISLANSLNRRYIQHISYPPKSTQAKAQLRNERLGSHASVPAATRTRRCCAQLCYSRIAAAARLSLEIKGASAQMPRPKKKPKRDVAALLQR